MAWSNFKTLSEIQNEQIVSWIFTNETKYNKKIFLSRFFYFAINFAFYKPFLVFFYWANFVLKYIFTELFMKMWKKPLIK